MPDAVIDTNVWISGLIKSKTVKLIIEALINKTFNLIVSRELLEELSDTLKEPKFKGIIDPSSAEALIALIQKRGRVVEIPGKLKVCRDSSDDFVLETALVAETQYLVTWDPDILALNPFQSIQIITPGNFLKKLNPD